MQLDFSLPFNSKESVDTTGYRLRKRREELGLTIEQLSQICGVSKYGILDAEKTNKYLNKKELEKVCNVFKIIPEDIIDNEYKFFYEGYREPIAFLIEKIGLDELIIYMNVKKNTVLRWKAETLIPNFQNRRLLVKKYNEIIST